MPEFRMPSLGADMDSGTLLEWLVKPGDAVHRGDVVAVVDTDKAAIEVECFDDGLVQELIVQPGQRVPVGTVLASIAGSGDAALVEVAATIVAEPEAVTATVAATAPLPSAPSGARVAPHVTSPLVRHLAQQRGVDLDSIEGSGPGGLVHRSDVEHAQPHRIPGRRLRATPFARRLAATAGLDLTTVVPSRADGAIAADDVRQSLAHVMEAPTVEVSAPVAAAAEPMAGLTREDTMRHAIATLMSRSNREIPHYYLTTTIDMSAAMAWMRERNKELAVEERLVPAALLIAAAARSAQAVAQLNGTWVNDEFRPAGTVDLGLVISLRRGGIMVPVIPDCAVRSVEEIMAAMRDLVLRTRTGRLKSSEMRPPSITVSNLGEQGVESVLGVIYPPQVALVGLGAVVERPWAVDGMLGVHPVVTASLAADHRASDGAVGARFLNRMDRLLQKPEEL